jgi:cell division protein ZapA
MGDKIKIRVTIANRVYPLNISSQNEEEGMRRATDKINDLVTRFEQDYAVSDVCSAICFNSRNKRIEHR